ncbi:hypothetical protein SUSP_002168 [Sulfurospirillum sp. 'SP']|nr:hypothetical protein [Sulfurospirillum sp. 'SP']WNY99750.1 hypothetical protein SUSP_002168 [Sulfurospirillum sp. 'SP']
MQDIEKMISTLGLSHFNMIDHEFIYLQSTIDILITNYQNNFQTIDNEHNQYIESLKQTGEYYQPLDEKYAPTITVGEMAENMPDESFYTLQNFSSIIIESLLIKHLAYVEDILVQISFLVQKKEHQIIPPNYPDLQNAKAFTDMLKAVEYIQLITENKLQINAIREWSIIRHLRTLRHKLAHGKRDIILKKSLIDEINKKILILQVDTPIQNQGLIAISSSVQSQYESSDSTSEWMCSITSDIKILKELNSICITFISEVKKMYIKRYYSGINGIVGF